MRNHIMPLHIKGLAYAGMYLLWQRSEGESDKCHLLLKCGLGFVSDHLWFSLHSSES